MALEEEIIVVSTAAKAPKRMDGLFESLEVKIDQTQQVTSRIGAAVGRLSGVMADDIQKEPTPSPVRNGATGRFEDNLDRLEKILNRLADIAAHLDEQV